MPDVILSTISFGKEAEIKLFGLIRVKSTTLKMN